MGCRLGLLYFMFSTQLKFVNLVAGRARWSGAGGRGKAIFLKIKWLRGRRFEQALLGCKVPTAQQSPQLDSGL